MIQWHLCFVSSLPVVQCTGGIFLFALREENLGMCVVGPVFSTQFFALAAELAASSSVFSIVLVKRCGIRWLRKCSRLLTPGHTWRGIPQQAQPPPAISHTVHCQCMPPPEPHSACPNAHCAQTTRYHAQNSHTFLHKQNSPLMTVYYTQGIWDLIFNHFLKLVKVHFPFQSLWLF